MQKKYLNQIYIINVYKNDDNITNLLNYENKKKEKEQFYFSNKGGNNYNNDYKQN